MSHESQLKNVILVGYLNLTLNINEKRSGSSVRDSSKEWVEDLIQKWDLMNINPGKGLYNWTNR